MKRALRSTGAAAALLAAGAWLSAAGCLNPRPEELPSNQDDPGFSGEGDVPSEDSASPSNPSGTPPAEPAPSPGASEAPPLEEQGAPADAGAPDAGPAASEACGDAEPQPETGEPPE